MHSLYTTSNDSDEAESLEADSLSSESDSLGGIDSLGGFDSLGGVDSLGVSPQWQQPRSITDLLEVGTQ
jgi:hypothetical protein